MEIFHVLGVGANLKALRLMNRKPKVLISAWSYHDPQNNYKSNAELIRENCAEVKVDSGFLSAAKNGQMEWANNTDAVLEAAEVLGADKIAMMDIPMEPHILLAAGFVRPDGNPDFERALDLTYRGAEVMMKAKTRAAKGFVNQGWTLEHREECQRTLMAMGVGEVADWWGVGTVCMRTPDTGLFEHAKWCRDNIKGHLHTFGIAQPAWVRQLEAFGVDSCDSATAAHAARYGKIIANGMQIDILGRRGEMLRRDNEMAALLYWYNMNAIEYEVNRPDAPPPAWQPGPQQARLAI